MTDKALIAHFSSKMTRDLKVLSMTMTFEDRREEPRCTYGTSNQGFHSLSSRSSHATPN